jgi:hypothetical protein
MPSIVFSSDQLISAESEQLSSQLGDETVVLSLKSGMYYGLNPVGARVWELAQAGPVSISTIRETICAEFDVEEQLFETDLSNLLAELQAEGLIRISQQS